MIKAENNKLAPMHWKVRPPSKEFLKIYSLGLDPEALKVIEDCLSECPVKLKKIADCLGVRVMLSTLPFGESGKINAKGNEFYIWINRHEPKHRQRFTLAHEISHYLLHRDQIVKSSEGWSDSVLFRSSQPHEVEYQANRLASDLVVPSSKLEEMTRSIKGSQMTDEIVKNLAGQFGVSKATMEIKLQIHSVVN